jgi:hypothetical protein
MARFETDLVLQAGKLISPRTAQIALDALTIGASLIGEGRVVKTAERTIPEIQGALAGLRSTESLLPEALGAVRGGMSGLAKTEASLSSAAAVLSKGATGLSEEALIDTAAMKDAQVFAPALWTSKPTVAKTFYRLMNVPQWSEISKTASASRKFLPSETGADTRIAEIAAARLPLVQQAANAVADSRGLAGCFQ